jgi:ribosomal protein L40E
MKNVIDNSAQLPEFREIILSYFKNLPSSRSGKESSMSAYRNKMVAVVKCNGQILREREGCIFVPFGSEYSLLLKNLATRRAKVKISIDGKDVFNGRELVMNANSKFELERFVDQLDKGRKFRFVQKTQEIVEARGDKIDDGFIRVEFAYEKAEPRYEDIYVRRHTYYDPWYDYPKSYIQYSAPIGSSAVRGMSINSCVNSCVNSSSSVAPPQIKQNEGITVRGSQSNQSFVTTWNFATDPTEDPIILRLKGYEETTKEVVSKPITVKTKLICPECGKSNPSTSKYCSTCGSALSLT